MAHVKLFVDDRQLSKFVTSTQRSEKRVLKQAFAAAIRPIIRQAKTNVRKSGLGSLVKAVRGGAWKRGGGATAYIRSPQDYRGDKHNFKLLFFEGGTKDRMAKRRNGRPMKRSASRGRITAGRYFSSAVAAREAQGHAKFEETLRQAIKKNESK